MKTTIERSNVIILCNQQEAENCVLISLNEWISIATAILICHSIYLSVLVQCQLYNDTEMLTARIFIVLNNYFACMLE